MDERLAALRQVLKDTGHRLTAARLLILETMVASGGHLTADELAEEARSRQSNIGRMTVYRTLDLLCELGLIRPMYQGTGAARFVLMDDGHHHHLVCSSCDRVFEFNDCVVTELEQSLGGRFSFEVRGHVLELFGFCEDCQN